MTGRESNLRMSPGSSLPARYVERNALRACLVDRVECWPLSSARWWQPGERGPDYLHLGPVDRGANWLERVQQAITDDELLALRTSVNRGRPYGNVLWMKETAGKLGLEFSMRPRGRPPKTKGAL